MDSLESRIEKLERSNFRLKLLIVGVLALFAGCNGITSHVETMHARRVIIVDPSDKEVGRLEGTASGAYLQLSGGGKQLKLDSNSALKK